MCVCDGREGRGTMHILPATAVMIPRNLGSEPASKPRTTLRHTVMTGIDGCIHVAIITPAMSMPKM